ncbi:hypothetical protein JHK87_031655 [Glycine soja]|nr:hypothetical protein JHK87_031655 [Glycine soja]
MDKEDIGERIHERAQFMIYKVLEKVYSRRKPTCVWVRMVKLKIKIENDFRSIKKKWITVMVSACYRTHLSRDSKRDFSSFGQQALSLLTREADGYVCLCMPSDLMVFG